MPSGDYAAFVEAKAGDGTRPGRIADAAGNTLGAHGGVHRFTVGQRKGLGRGLTGAALRAADRGARAPR